MKLIEDYKKTISLKTISYNKNQKNHWRGITMVDDMIFSLSLLLFLFNITYNDDKNTTVER